MSRFAHRMTMAYLWLRTTRGQMALARGIFIQLALGTVIVGVLSAQYIAPAIEQARKTQELSDRAQTLEIRTGDLTTHIALMEQKLEGLRIDARLAVLEDMSTRISKIEFLVYGLILTMLGNLALNMLHLKQKEKD